MEVHLIYSVNRKEGKSIIGRLYLSLHPNSGGRITVKCVITMFPIKIRYCGYDRKYYSLWVNGYAQHNVSVCGHSAETVTTKPYYCLNHVDTFPLSLIPDRLICTSNESFLDIRNNIYFFEFINNNFDRILIECDGYLFEEVASTKYHMWMLFLRTILVFSFKYVSEKYCFAYRGE